MKLCDCKDWKAVHFPDRTILKKDCPYMSGTQLHELAETEVEPNEPQRVLQSDTLRAEDVPRLVSFIK